MENQTNVLIDNLKFTEGLRWHSDRLWFCDLWDRKVYSADLNGNLKTEVIIDDEPVGLGWLSDGTLLITSLMDRKLLAYKDGKLSVYCDLQQVSPGYCHDFTVSKDDYIYLSTSGFYPAYGVKPVSSSILMITPEKKIKITAKNIGYPNGIKIAKDGKRLFISETFAASIASFEIDIEHQLIHQQ